MDILTNTSNGHGFNSVLNAPKAKVNSSPRFILKKPHSPLAFPHPPQSWFCGVASPVFMLSLQGLQGYPFTILRRL